MSYYARIQALASQFGLRDSLEQIWCLSNHIVYGTTLPTQYGGADYRDVEGHTPGKIREFQLDLYAREIIMHARSSKRARRSLCLNRDLRAFHNAIVKYGDKRNGLESDPYLTIHRLSHEQMHHFDRADWSYIGRYALLMENPRLDRLYCATFGMTASEYIQFAVGLLTIYCLKSECVPVEALAALHIERSAILTCVERLQATAMDIRKRMRSRVRHTAEWQYTFNELVTTPLIQLPGSQPGSLICPRPPLLVKRLMAGSLVDLIRHDPGEYSAAVGEAVDETVGKICAKVFRGLLHKPTPYGLKGRRRAGVDWIIADDSGCLYIECKAAQIRKEARVASTLADLAHGLQPMALAVAQNAENILDVVESRTSWDPSGRPAYSLIVTLEDWVIFSPTAVEELRRLAGERLAQRGLDPALLDRFPFSTTSLSDLPNLLAAISREGIDKVLRAKAGERYSRYMLSAFLRESGRCTETSRSFYKGLGDAIFLRMQDALANGEKRG